MKKHIALVLAVLCIFFSVPSAGLAAFDTQIDFKSDTLLLMSLDDGTVIIEKNSRERRAPAGLLGIAAAITVIENCENLEEFVAVKKTVLDSIAGLNVSSVNLKEGESLKVIDLLYTLMLCSATDAAVVLADYIGGSAGYDGGNIENFVKMMNETAAKAGCLDTNFTNPHGLDDDAQYTTAYDLALITSYALKNGSFASIAKAYSHTIEATNKSDKRDLYTTNLMMNSGYQKYYYSLAEGLRTGTTEQAGRCVISTASKDGYSYLGVVMKAPVYDGNNNKIETNYAFTDCAEMFRWTFNNIKLRVVAEPYRTVTEIKLNLSSDSDYLQLVPEKEVAALVPSGINSEDVLIKPIPEETQTEVDAPVKKGDMLGVAQILYAGEEIARVNLVAAESFELSSTKYLARTVKNILTSKFFIILCVIFVLITCFYVIFVYSKKPKRKGLKLVKGNSQNVRASSKKRPSSAQKKPDRNNDKDKPPDPPKSILR